MFAESEDSLLQFIVRYEVILEYTSFLIIVYQTLAAMKGLGLHIVELLAGYPDLNGLNGMIRNGDTDDILKVFI